MIISFNGHRGYSSLLWSLDFNLPETTAVDLDQEVLFLTEINCAFN